MGALIVLGLLGLLSVLDISSSSADGSETSENDPSLNDEAMILNGIEGQVDVLTGGQSDDTISGNFDEEDQLNGNGGDDLLIVQDGNIATGGAGSDTFDLTNGEKGVITDFDPNEDALQILFLRGAEGSEEEEKLSWRVTEDGVELHASLDEDAKQTESTRLVTLLGLTEPPENAAIALTSLS